MKIPILVKSRELNKYDRLLFEFLQKDERFEVMIVRARKNLGLDGILVQKEDGDLEVKIKSSAVLRSELQRSKVPTPRLYVEMPFSLLLFEETERIIGEYGFLGDLHKGIESFVCGDGFLVSDEVGIKLRVNNKKFLNLGKYADHPGEEGVKIVLNSRFSKKELKDWVNENYDMIVYFVRSLPNYSPRTKRRKNYERDRLVVYLKDKWTREWHEIADKLEKIGPAVSEDTLQQAYKDFPSK